VAHCGFAFGKERMVGHKQRCRNRSSTVRKIALGRPSSRGKLAASKKGWGDEYPYNRWQISEDPREGSLVPLFVGERALPNVRRDR
jgi:hypothetical protein